MMRVSQPRVCEGGIPDHASLICSVVLEVKERCPPPSPTTIIWQRKLIPLAMHTRESRPCTLSGQPSRIDPVDKGAVEQTRQCECGKPGPFPHLPFDDTVKERCPLSLSTPEACGRTGSDVIRVGELPLHPISSNTRENRPCSLPEPHNKDNPVCGVVSVRKLFLLLITCVEAWALEKCPLPLVPHYLQ